MQKNITKIGQEKFLLLVKLKTQFRRLKLLVTQIVNQLLQLFMKKNCKKPVKKNSEQKKYLKEKEINCMSNGKDTTIHLINGLTKKTLNEIPSYKNQSILR